MSKASKQSRWSKAVRKRDNYTCNICLSTTDLTAHHLNSSDPKKRYSVANGVCLCATCHRRFHQAYRNIYCNKNSACSAHDYHAFKSRNIEKRAKAEGRCAFRQDLTRCDNPYPSSSMHYVFWDRAFRFEQQQTTYQGYEEYIT